MAYGDDFDKVAREPVEVIIYLEGCKIRGVVHLPPGGRLSDFINAPSRQFIPISDAKVESISSVAEWSYEVDFLNLNKNYIISMFPRTAYKGDRIK